MSVDDNSKDLGNIHSPTFLTFCIRFRHLRILSATFILSKNSRVLDANLGKNRLISASLG